MHNLIYDKVKRLCEYYSPCRTEPLLERFDAFWDGRLTERVPFTIRRRGVPAGLHSDQNELSVFTPEELLHAQLDDRLSKMSLADDYLPSLITGNSPYYLSIAFGADWERVDGGTLVAHPIIQSKDDISKLKVPDYGKIVNNPFGECMKRIDFFLNETEEKIPLVLPDPQGPLSLVAQLWKMEELFIAMIESPEAVHQIMNIATGAIIEFFEFLFQKFGRKNFIAAHCMPYIYRKPGDGISLSEDMFGVLYPQHLEEFLVPYLNKISSRFGGLLLHSCGDCSRRLDVLGKIENLAGAHFSQTDVPSCSFAHPNNLAILSQNDWDSRQQIADYAEAVKQRGLNCYIQIHLLEGEFDHKQTNVEMRSFEDLSSFMVNICRR